MIASIPEWVEIQDDKTGKPYFWNTKTNTTAWDRPQSATPIMPLATLLPLMQKQQQAALQMVQSASKTPQSQTDNILKPVTQPSAQPTWPSMNGTPPTSQSTTSPIDNTFSPMQPSVMPYPTMQQTNASAWNNDLFSEFTSAPPSNATSATNKSSDLFF